MPNNADLDLCRDDPALADASRTLDPWRQPLRTADADAAHVEVWSEPLWKLVVDLGGPRWSLPADFDGSPLGRVELLAHYLMLTRSSLTAAFVLSQHDAAVRRLLPAASRPVARAWLEAIARGRAFATVGISQLTTSRRHGTCALRAVAVEGGFQLAGVMPWVTAAGRAEVIVAGAVCDDGRQILAAVPTDRAGLTVPPAFELAALTASSTCEVVCEQVFVSNQDLLAGPAVDVLAAIPGATGTGGLETSALALGQALSALEALAEAAQTRVELAEPLAALAADWCRAWHDLAASARDEPDAPPSSAVRAAANSLALRATQAYLTARKGSGFLRTDPAQQWARQALFFLVWSCPGPVAHAAIRDLAGICST